MRLCVCVCFAAKRQAPQAVFQLVNYMQRKPTSFDNGCLYKIHSRFFKIYAPSGCVFPLNMHDE